ncbi:MAG: hypothetical protein AW10_01153 [Candidatus Accumulibacter appositus]|uniref:Uncharacterized protein n=1 Tax=Candidatus Accumulibacter appositus TaxID=1454003 RepID=A0A011P1E3_9PROT|nr:MAG: hypothetical protein AW10_01153 [Candidatus Accumulibacter appositus]
MTTLSGPSPDQRIPPTSLAAVSDTLSGVPARDFGDLRDELGGRHSGDFLRLQRLLEHGDGFQLVFAACVSVAHATK